MKTTGLVIGKFMPLHSGHMHLINYAKQQVERLLIVIDSLLSQPIPGDFRYDCLKKTYPDCEIFHLKEMPQTPVETDDFWQIWEDRLKLALPTAPDFVFASESYGYRLAEIFKAKFVMVDFERNAVPISATEIRANPMQYWDLIAPAARSYFLKKICLFGPESTGKTTLCQQLSQHFKTVYVPEYARQVIEGKNGKIDYEDFVTFATEQINKENQLAATANRILFCDSDAITTKLYSQLYFNSYPWELDSLIKNSNYDLYLLTDTSLKFKKDQTRNFVNERQKHFEIFKNALIKHKRNFIVISGQKNRFKQAITAVSKLIES